jgi:transcription elongation factor Elf1
MSDDVETTSEETSEPTAEATQQDIAFECPMCGKAMIVSAEGAGEIVMCPACDQEVIVPGGPLWDEVQAQMEAEAQQAGESTEAAVEEETVEQPAATGDLAELRERLRTMENQLRENRTQCTETAEAITQALNQATRYKLKLQRLEEKQRVLESMVDEARQRVAALERLG